MDLSSPQAVPAVACPVCESSAVVLEEMNGFPMCEDCASEFPNEQDVNDEAILALRRDLGLEGAWE
jgi:hypothetical protein